MDSNGYCPLCSKYNSIKISGKDDSKPLEDKSLSKSSRKKNKIQQEKDEYSRLWGIHTEEYVRIHPLGAISDIATYCSSKWNEIQERKRLGFNTSLKPDKKKKKKLTMLVNEPSRRSKRQPDYSDEI